MSTIFDSMGIDSGIIIIVLLVIVIILVGFMISNGTVSYTHLTLPTTSRL